MDYYELSTDYEELYRLVESGKRVFCKLVSRDGVVDYSTVYKDESGALVCGVRGLSYIYISKSSDDHKARFIRECKELQLEYLKPKN